ncbi:hypothetical protein CsSME_00042358 [Camellia sinensis var. sinensis]
MHFHFFLKVGMFPIASTENLIESLETHMACAFYRTLRL